MASDLFGEEMELARQARQFLEDTPGLDPEAAARFSGLLGGFTKFLKTAQHLVRVSDRNEEKLLALSERLEEKNRDLNDLLEQTRLQAEALAASRAQLLSRERQLKAIVENLPAMAILKDAAGRYKMVNTWYETATGIRAGDILGKTDAEVFSSEIARSIGEMDHLAIERGAPISFEKDIPHPDGTQRVYLITKVPITGQDGGHEGLVVLATDITELRRAARLKEDVERIVRHDIKTPLTSILSVPQILLLADNLSGHQREMLSRVEDAAYTVLSMVNLSLDLFKMERGDYHLNAEAVDIVPVIGKILASREDEMAMRGQTAAVLIDARAPGPGEEFVILGEELLCFSMLANLVTNALEAAPRDSAVSINLIRGDMARIAIHNLGAVPRDMRERFFEKYATSGKDKGTGLGTYSARLIARTMHGDVSFTTSEELGTTVTVSLPPG